MQRSAGRRGRLQGGLQGALRAAVQKRLRNRLQVIIRRVRCSRDSGASYGCPCAFRTKRGDACGCRQVRGSSHIVRPTLGCLSERGRPVSKRTASGKSRKDTHINRLFTDVALSPTEGKETCTGTCKIICKSTCEDAGCKALCQVNCKDSCTAHGESCATVCEQSCKPSGKCGTCLQSCQGGCQSSCESACQAHCTEACQATSKTGGRRVTSAK